MSITSKRNIQLTFSGDISLNVIQSALDNATSLGVETIFTLQIGSNPITPPASSGSVATALTIIPPAGNTHLLTLQGVQGDTGIPMHKTDPTVIALDTTFTSLNILTAAIVPGVRFIWS